MAVITISRQFGAGGRTLGRMIAKEMDYVYLDEVIIGEIAKKANVSKDWVKSMERNVGGTISKLFAIMLNKDYMSRLIGDTKGYLDENVYMDVLREIIVESAAKDNVIIMGRGGQYILAEDENAFHIHLVSDMAHRITFMQQFYKLNEAKAQQAVTLGEKKRTAFFAKFGKADYDNPQLYHLVLNMSKLSLEDAKNVVCLLVNQKAA